MGLFDKWREARGTAMKHELDDLLSRLEGANGSVMSAYYNNITTTIGPLRESYRTASAKDRKVILEQCRKASKQMWSSGDWPSALGLGVSRLNIESGTVPGEDSVFVKAQTDKIITKAEAFLNN